jgi:predicted metallopeptidase
MVKMTYERAPDVDLIVHNLLQKFPGKLTHINGFRIICVRSQGSTVSAYARIWSMPQVWKTALEIDTFYVLEVISKYYDKQSDDEKEKTILHELLHIPKTFSGALLPHVYGKEGKDIEEKVQEYYREI